MGAQKGIQRANEIYRDRSRRVLELKADGKEIIGYLCIYPVIEMITAAGMVPYRLFGDIREPKTKVEACLPTVVCPYLRSVMDIGLKERYNFLDGVVMAHSCEVAEKLAHIWKTYIDQKYAFFLDVPHTIHDAAREQFRDLINDFKLSLEKYTGSPITDEMIVDAINAHNQQRSLVKELYDLKKSDKPKISGVETVKVLMAIMSLPVEEGNELLEEVITEVKGREGGDNDDKKRLLLWGSIIDDTALFELIEDVGADVVIDDTCVGTRPFFPDVELTDDPLVGLANRYLVDIKCPRTFKEANFGEKKKDYMEDLESRFGYIKQLADDWNVDGIILHSLRYCDIHGYDIPGLKDYFESVGIRSIYIEPDYTEAALAPLRTRIEAFLETLD